MKIILHLIICIIIYVSIGIIMEDIIKVREYAIYGLVFYLYGALVTETHKIIIKGK